MHKQQPCVVSRLVRWVSTALLSGAIYVCLPYDASNADPQECSEEKVKQVLADPENADDFEVIDCHLNLSPNDTVKKRLILEGESAVGVNIDCNGATLDGGDGVLTEDHDRISIHSVRAQGSETVPATWQRPHDISIRRCKIIGSIRVWGITPAGRNIDVFRSSISSEHAATLRDIAPTNIILDEIELVAVGKTPLYLSPGVTHVRMTNSEISGETDSVVVYLDAESCCNTFRANRFRATTSERSVIAIDASNYNLFVNNRFSGLNHGGIYLYRNSGERGVVRHTTPSYNSIINNVFEYKKYKGDSPSIYVGSRGSLTRKKTKAHDDADRGFHFGSSISGLDYARHNVIMQNQILKRRLSDMILSRGWENNSPNYIGYNTRVTSETVRRHRPAGCFVKDGYGTKFIFDGESIEVFEDARGLPIRAEYAQTCEDGNLIRSGRSQGGITRVNFDCYTLASLEGCNKRTQAISGNCPLVQKYPTGNNKGCRRVVSCPSDQSIIGMKAACNLEYGFVSNDQLSMVPDNTLGVIRASDNISDGSCFVEDRGIDMGEMVITEIADKHSVLIGCDEHDENRGDCHIKGILQCQ